MGIRRLLGEPFEAFVQRHHLAGGHLATACDRWSQAWAAAVVSWDDHVQRGHDSMTWALTLRGWRSEWRLTLQRLLHSRPGESRTRFRTYRGRVQQRWSDGMALARAKLSSA